MPGAALERRRARPALQANKKGCGAEQYNANKFTGRPIGCRGACAEDTKGQTCFICTQACIGRQGGPRARGACRGTGFAHVSCLANRLRLLRGRRTIWAQGEAASWARCRCSLCEQYHGVVRCAPGGRAEDDESAGGTKFELSDDALGNGLPLQTPRGRVFVQRPVGYDAARRTERISRKARVNLHTRLDATKALYASRCLLWKFEAQWRGT